MTNDLHDLLEAAIIILDDAVSGKNEHVTHEKRQKYLHLVNESNANRDNGKRFKE